MWHGGVLTVLFFVIQMIGTICETQLARIDSEVQATTEAIDHARAAAATAQAVRTQAAGEAREAASRAAPPSVFVSRKTRKIYVRQAMKPLFEADVAILRPDEALGTFVFTAIDAAPGGDQVRWNAVALKLAGDRKVAGGSRAVAGSMGAMAGAIAVMIPQLEAAMAKIERSLPQSR